MEKGQKGFTRREDPHLPRSAGDGGKHSQLARFAERASWVAGGAVAYLFINMLAGREFLLRPPGALAAEEFLATCVRCGACAQACPYRSIKIAGPSHGVSTGTPYIQAREIPCYLCPDFLCNRACPSGALRGVQSLEDVQMGTAQIVREECIAWKGLRCEVCYRRCPLMGKALVIEKFHNPQTGVHAIFAPHIQKEHCVGCGICEHVCVTEKPAVVIARPSARIRG